MVVIKFQDVSKKYKLYSKGGLYLRDRITHALQRFNPFNGIQRSAVSDQPSVSETQNPLPVTQNPTPNTLPPLERDFWALKDVSFEIKQGESVGFIGRNGAGKSTILKLLAGVTRPSSGKVDVQGRVAALIEVGAGFHPELTGRENIYLNGSILGMKKTEIEKRFDSIVAFAELEDFIDTPVKHYSSGMYVRLGFAVAAHTDPDIFLIDEVLSVGDEAFQKKCLDRLEAHKESGKTMILVSHNLEKVAEVCDRVIYVSHGEVRGDGEPPMVIKTYRSDVAAGHGSRSSKDRDPYGSKIAIVNIRFRDGRGRETSQFKPGDDLLIEICYQASVRVENVRFGIAIHSEKGECLGILTTAVQAENFCVLEGSGSVQCRIPAIPFRRGTYSVSAAIHNNPGARDYDRHWGSSFLVTSEDKGAALLRLQGEWSIQRDGLMRVATR